MRAIFRIKYNTEWGQNLFLVARDKKYPMKWGEGAVWSVTIPKFTLADLEDYTYVVMRDGCIERTEWNHHSQKVPKGTVDGVFNDKWLECPIKGCPFPREHQAAIFDRPGFRGAGTAVPIFSLRSAAGFGIGEFRDLHPLIDWASATGQCVIQLLPINDTTRDGSWEDSYPYKPVSSFALNPMYIRLEEIGVKDDAAFCRKRKALNKLPDIDYPAVYKAKTAYMHKAFEVQGQIDAKTAAYKKFCKDNAYWLDEYSAFYAERDSDSPDFHRWIQYHLEKQLKEEVAYARSKGVSLKGDLPIGVSADSADARFHPELFNLDSRAGAPPDFFSKEGQNWGFPTYNWDKMAIDGYAWWKARLRKMAEFFDAFRIDHILGFSRIWEIPAQYSGGSKGHFNPALPYSADELAKAGLPEDPAIFLEDPHRKGWFHPRISPDTSALDFWQKKTFDGMYWDFFYNRHEAFWKHNGQKKIPELLTATGMLACGEDLGMVPKCVHEVMDHEKILSLEMPQMDKGRPWPYLSVCTTSSHDLETLRMQKPEEDRTPQECEQILRDNLGSVSMLAIFPIQDWLSIDPDLRRKDFMSERINYPADALNKWKYRLHINLEDLAKQEKFTAKVADLIKKAGR